MYYIYDFLSVVFVSLLSFTTSEMHCEHKAINDTVRLLRLYVNVNVSSGRRYAHVYIHVYSTVNTVIHVTNRHDYHYQLCMQIKLFKQKWNCFRSAKKHISTLHAYVEWICMVAMRTAYSIILMCYGHRYGNWRWSFRQIITPSYEWVENYTMRKMVLTERSV